MYGSYHKRDEFRVRSEINRAQSPTRYGVGSTALKVRHSGEDNTYSKLQDKHYKGQTLCRKSSNVTDTVSMGNSANRLISRGNSPVLRRKNSSSNGVSNRRLQLKDFESRLPPCSTSLGKNTYGSFPRCTSQLKDDQVVPCIRRNSADSGYNSGGKVYESRKNSSPDRSRQNCLYTGKSGKTFYPEELNDGIIDLDKRNKTRPDRTDCTLLSRGKSVSQECRRSGGVVDGESLSGGLRRTRLDNDIKTRSYAGQRSVISKSPKTGTDGLVGLQNLGNTCFMNSILQCLSHCRPLRNQLLCGDSLNHNSQSKMKGKLVSAFVELIKAMWSKTRSEIAVSPHSFKLQIQRFSPRFVGYEQQDSQEFLRFLLDGLHEDLKRTGFRKSSRTSQELSHLSEKELSDYMWRQYKSRDDSLVTDLFCGQMMSTLTCTKCNHRSVTFDPFWDLSLSIPRPRTLYSSYSSSQFSHSSSVTLVDCLNLFTSEEDLDGDEKPKCEKCKVRQKCQKQFKIQTFPKILVLHLKRFSGFGFRSKLQTDVDFPLSRLDMSQFASSSSDSRSVKYSLFAVSNHSGSTYGGHYTAYCKHPESQEWHSFNDSRVSALTSSSIRGPHAYVLFYEMEDLPNSML